MTNRERVINSMAFEKVDRLAFAPLCDGYFSAGLPAQGHEDDVFAALKYIDCDIIMRHVPCYKKRYENVTVKTENNNGLHTVTYQTSKGNLSRVHYRENGTTFRKKHLIETLEDLEIFNYIVQNTYYEPCFEEFERCDAMIGDRGIATASAPMSPLLELIQKLSGLENVTYSYMDDVDLLEEVMKSMHERNKRAYTMLKKLPSQYIFTYEDTSTTLLSRSWMKDYAVPSLNDYADIVHSAGKKFITHMCGKLSGFSCEIAGVKSDGIDSVCPPTTGDTTLQQAREAYPNKFIIGGIEPPSMVLKSRSELMHDIVNSLNGLESKRGIILSSGDAVPHGTNIETLKHISDMVKYLGEKSLESKIDKKDVEKFLI